MQMNGQRVFKTFVCAFLLLMIIEERVLAFRAWDCAGNRTASITIDLTEPQMCEDIESYYHEPTEIRAQIMAVDIRRSVAAFQCSATEDSDVTRCGFDSLTYGTHQVLIDRPLSITMEDCRKIVRDRKWNYMGREFSVKIGRENIFKFYAHGKLEEDGTCRTEDFSVNGYQFYKSYEERRVRLEVKAVQGVLDEDSGTTVVKGVRGEYQNEGFYDHKLGTIIWRATEAQCHESVSELYLGPVHLHKHKNGTVGSFVILSNNRTGQYGGFLLKKPTSLCQVQGFRTQIPSIVIRILRRGDSPLPHSRFRSNLLQTEMNLMSRMSYLHLKTNTNVEAQFGAIYEELCSSKRATIINRLRMLSHSNNQYVALDIFGEGHTVYSSGAVAHVTRCAPVEAKIRALPNCTRDIPVYYGEDKEPAFVDPISMVVKARTHVLACNPIMPIIWSIDGKWWCSSPELRVCPDPLRIDIAMEAQYQPRDFAEELDGSMYTEEHMQIHRDYVMFANAREPILDTLAYKSDRGAERGGETGMPLSPQDYLVLSHIVGLEISPGLFFFGKYWFVLWTLLTLGGVIRLVLDTVIKIYLGLKRKPPGFWILKVLVHSSFLLLLYPIHVLQAAAGGADSPDQDEQRSEPPTYQSVEGGPTSRPGPSGKADAPPLPDLSQKKKHSVDMDSSIFGG